MRTRRFHLCTGAAGLLLALSHANASSQAAATSSPPESVLAPMPARASLLERSNEQLCAAASTVRMMEVATGLAAAMQEAKGIFIVPHYTRVALGVGGRGGEGVLLIKHGDEWGAPAFFSIGGISVGVQAGVEHGPLAFILNSQRALARFQHTNNWSLNADAGLTIANWNAKGRATLPRSDIVVWAGTAGLLGNLAVSVTDIHYDMAQTTAFYGTPASLADVAGGKLQVASPQLAALLAALPAPADQRSGSSGTSGALGTSGGTACPR